MYVHSNTCSNQPQEVKETTTMQPNFFEFETGGEK